MQVDPRGQRFAAVLTSIVLILVLVTSSWLLLAVQAAVFLIGVLFGLRSAPYGLIYQALIRPRLGSPKELEPEAPPRFAQGVGAVFALAGVVGYALGIPALGMTATALALVAAFLNAAFGLCLGCEAYLLFRRLTPGRATS
jgi:Domain of unknown function (DUF4395)